MKEEDLADVELVDRARGGDSVWFGLLVKRHQDFIVQFLFRYTRDRELSLDQAQETFIKAYRALSSFKNESSFRTWLTSIALNSARSAMKKRTPVGENNDGDPIVHEDLESAIDNQRKVNLLKKIIVKLKPELREVLQICAMEGFSYSDAAKVLNVPIGTVCSRMHTALKEVRFLFSKEVGHE